MQNMETLLSELFGYQLFARDEKLQSMIDDTLNRYDDDSLIPLDELSAAAGGVTLPMPDHKESE